MTQFQESKAPSTHDGYHQCTKPNIVILGVLLRYKEIKIFLFLKFFFYAHQQVQISHVCLDVVFVVGFDFGETFELGFGLRLQRVHEGGHPPVAGGDALPRQAWTETKIDQHNFLQ